MSKEFIKTASGLEQVAQPKIKIYPTLEDLDQALANGDIQDGEIVASKFIDESGDIAADIEILGNHISDIEGKIPVAASSTNKLVDTNTFNALAARVGVNETNIQTNADDIDALETRATTDEGNIQTNADDIDALEGRMDTAEDDIDALEGRLQTAEDDIDTAEGRITTLESRQNITMSLSGSTLRITV